MQRNLRNIFHRMQMTEQDVRTLRGMIVRLVEGPRAQAKDKTKSKAQSLARDKGAATLSKDLPSAATPKRASTTAAKTIRTAPKR